MRTASIVSSRNVTFARLEDSAITAAITGSALRTTWASRLVITGLRRNASRSCSSSVMTPTRSTRNVPIPTSLTRASAT